MSDRCVCGEIVGGHHCLGDPHAAAIQAELEHFLQVRTCSECGTEDPTVMPAGGLCALCAELSALQAPAKEAAYRRWRRHRLAITLGIWTLAVLVLVEWLVIR